MCQMHLPNRKISQMRSYLFRTRPSIPFANEELGQWIWKCSESMCRIMYFYANDGIQRDNNYAGNARNSKWSKFTNKS